MLLLFSNLYLSMFTGEWRNLSWTAWSGNLKTLFNDLGSFITSIFGDNTYTTLGSIFDRQEMSSSAVCVVAFILGLITSIGIVVMAVKGIKRVFGVFFMGIRNL